MSDMRQLVYKVGGVVEPTDPSYVFRPADRHLYEQLKAGEFCYVFNCRQMGKTSLRYQTMQRLINDNQYRCVSIDLTLIGSSNILPKEWYRVFAKKVHNALLSDFPEKINFNEWWAAQEGLPPIPLLNLYFDMLLKLIPDKRIVIFIDEIDTVLDLDCDVSDFFAWIRACFNLRGEDAEYDRLTFALFGVATPESLGQGEKTPFNIGKEIELSGFEFEESQKLLEGLVNCGPNRQNVLREIFHWTGGQPFLTQKLCDLVQKHDDLKIGELVAGEEAEWIEKIVQLYIITNGISQVHLRHIKKRVFNKSDYVGRMLGVYKQILEYGEVDADGSEEHLYLRLSGLVVQEAGKLKRYNRIYEAVFSLSWVEQEQNKLRSYAVRLKQWLESGCHDESQLLQGKALLDALTETKGKSLADEDYHLLAASQDLARREEEWKLSQAQNELTEIRRDVAAIKRRSRRSAIV